ncbi:unnamed protein product [Mycena citricolor]|uniref:Ubiquitin-like protease family profile domain-containing protein n=1 Tax=Mycena citricolor TaxID=2018698 RepID=A0AAD2H6B0_9AGAR|nr:unnamed protein product [Mycena citricolor]
MYEMHTSSGGQITPSKCVDASASAFFSQQHPANASAGLPNVDADASADNYVHANASAQSQDMIQVALSAPSANLHLPTSLDEVEDDVFDGFTDTEEINIALQALNITECDDTTIPDEGSVQIDIRWDVPLTPLKYDLDLFSELQARNNSLPRSSALLPHIVVRDGSLKNYIFEPADLARIMDPHGLLSGQCINGVAASFQALFSHVHNPHHPAARRCALLSTYELPRMRSECSDDFLWSELEAMQYWERDLWILPIHRATQQHWVLAVACVSDRRIYFFDSLALRGGFRKELKVCHSLSAIAMFTV